MSDDREQLLKEIDYIVDDLWSGMVTQQSIAEEMAEKAKLLIQHLRILRDKLREEEE